ncbi:MFS transporter [Amycolatopsis silviterrae]|uniref:MFS transporter n=1 Tax=Amycolatopsis silviterrae TaxID=1656914 RepID=A0ABW5HPU1_9PSEU
MLVDFVYEGGRSVVGPLLAHLGASAAVVGLVTGAGEASALALRLVSGPLADRTRRFWSWTIAGYAVTVAAVPLLGLTGVLWAAGALVIAERVGKAVRSPAKDTLLSHATADVGRGRGFAVHEAMDQVGAILGPLAVAGVLAVTDDGYGPALGMLAVPGVFAVFLLLRLRARVPDPAVYETPEAPGTAEARLPWAFWAYAGFTAVTLTGFATFGLLSYHLVEHRLLPAAAVPVVYAAAMTADAVAALASGWLYDRLGSRTVAALPLLSAVVPVLAFGGSTWLAVLGALAWGAGMGIQESTLRAAVAELVPARRRATAYGLFAGVAGLGTFAGGALTGVLYDRSIPVLAVTVAAIQAVALAVLLASRRFRGKRRFRYPVRRR